MGRGRNIFARQMAVRVLMIGAFLGVAGCPALIWGQATSQQAWPQPKSLLTQLDQLAQHPPTKAWAKTTQQLIAVISDDSRGSRQRMASLTQLVKQRDELGTLHAQTLNANLPPQTAEAAARELIRMHYRLSRRIDVWAAVLALPVREELGDAGSMIRQVNYGNLDFSGLPESWVSFLRLDEYRPAFASFNPDPELQRETARRILARIYSPALGEDQSKFVLSVIDEKVLEFLRERASEPVRPDDLLKRLEYYESASSNRASHYLNERYQDLLWSDRAEERAVAAMLDNHYRNANFRLAISEQFMNRLLPQLPTIAEPVSDTVQGALVTGNSQVSNQIKVNLIPDAQRLNFQIQTDGHVVSDTVARTKGFRILNQGEAQFQVYKQITVDKNGIDSSKKAFAKSWANQAIVGIQSKLDHMPMLGQVARRMAEKKVREQAPETNQLFRRKVAKSAELRVEEELSKQIAQVEKSASEYLMQPLMALELDPEAVQMATTKNQVVMRYRLAGRDQMAANTARPMDNGSSLVSFQVHQSLVNNIIARLNLNGRTFNSQTLAEHLQQELGLERRTVSVSDDEARDAEFTFDRFDPIKIDFAGDRIKITLNFSKLKLSDKKEMRRVSMTAAYSVHTRGLQVNLIQDDKGTVLGGRRVGEKMMISTIMKVLFDKEYHFNGLPQQFRNSEQAQQLSITQLVIADGWIGVSLDDDDPRQMAGDSQGSGNQANEDARFGGNLRRLLERR